MKWSMVLALVCLAGTLCTQIERVPAANPYPCAAGGCPSGAPPAGKVHCPTCGRLHDCCTGFWGCNTCTGKCAYRRSLLYTWHGDYYHPAYGAPVALVVPPTAGRMTGYHWGVAGYRTTPIYHQFRKGFPGYNGNAGRSFFKPTPLWPSDTDQFGVYYVRGPW